MRRKVAGQINAVNPENRIESAWMDTRLQQTKPATGGLNTWGGVRMWGSTW